jgi:1,4-alpha-glucan branching enzyme
MSKKKNHKKAIFAFIAPEAQSVQLAGDFNSWDPNAHPLKRTSNERWETRLNLSPGRYEYKFLVDGQWQNDPNCTDFASNPFGDENCVLVLK